MDYEGQESSVIVSDESRVSVDSKRMTMSLENVVVPQIIGSSHNPGEVYREGCQVLYICLYILIFIFIYVYTCMYIHIYLYIYISIYIYIYVYIHVYVYICIHMYIHIIG
jgi:hypothetical protein